MNTSKTLEERIVFIRGSHRRLKIKVQESKSSERVDKLLEGAELQAQLSHLAREERTTIHIAQLPQVKLK